MLDNSPPPSSTLPAAVDACHKGAGAAAAERVPRRSPWWRSTVVALVFTFFTVPKFVWRTLIVAYIAFAVCFLSLRYVVAPQVELRRQEIAQALSGALKLRADIGVIRADWDGLRPRVHLENVRLFDKSERLALELPRVDASLAWSSLLRWQLELHRLEIAGADLSIRRDASGKFFVAGIPIESNDSADDGGFAQFLLRQHHIFIRNARLNWQDDLRGATPLWLNGVALRLENRGGRHRFAFAASPPSAYSDAIDLRGDLRVVNRRAALSDIANWRGALYARLDRADLAVWQKWIDYPIQLPTGYGAMRTWINFEGKDVVGVTADLALRDVKVRFADDLQMLALASFSGRLKGSRRDKDYSLSGERLQLVTADGLATTQSGFALRAVAARGQMLPQGELSADKLDMRVLTELAAYVPIDAAVRDRLRTAQARGTVVKATAQWHGVLPRPERFTVAAEFEKLAANPIGTVPGFEGLSGSLRGDEKSGSYRLEIAQGSLNLPRVMHTAKMPFDRLLAEGGWSRSPDAEWAVEVKKLTVANTDAEGQFSGKWTSEGPLGTIDLSGQLNRANVAAVWRYMPVVVGDHVIDWLQKGLLAGAGRNVQLRLVGDLDDFPFRDNAKGMFKVAGDFTGAKIDFAPGWLGLERVDGALLFEGARMLISGRSGYYKAAQVRDVEVEIADLMDHGKQVLTVKGKASGPTQDFLAYVTASRIGDRVGAFTGDIVAQGGGQLDLHIAVPLHDVQHTVVKGDYAFADNELRLIPSLPTFSNASGKLLFDEREFHVQQAQADFIGSRVSAKSTYEPDGTLRIDANGIVPVKNLNELVASPLWRYVSGEAPAHAAVRIKKQGVELAVRSDLQGVASQLPAPMNKTVAEALPTTVSWQMARVNAEKDYPKAQTWKIELGERASAQWVAQCVGGQPAKPCEFTRGAFAINDALSLPQKGMRLSGRFAKLNLDDWRPVLATMNADGAATANAGGDVAAQLAGGVWHAEELVVAGHVFRKVVARATQQNNDWVLRLEGPDVAGDVAWSSEGRGKLNARLQHLVLRSNGDGTTADNAGGRGSTEAIQERMPALDVVANSFTLRDMALGRLNLQAVNQGATWRLDHFSLEGDDHKLSGSGQWERAGPNAGTQLNLVLATENTGLLLTRLGYPDAINRGQAALRGQVRWRGAPTRIDYPSLSGSLKLEAANGQFRKIDPGAGRLLGVLSLQALPRRVSLDFRDVFSEGFAFDSIAGNFAVQNGLLSTKDLQIRGPAAKVSMEGSTDLGREVHDLKVTVQPTLSETVAVGTVVAQTAVGVVNPLLGLATYVAQKILSDPIEKIFSYDYTITGAWADPKIEKTRTAAAAPDDDEVAADAAAASSANAPAAAK